MAKENSNADGAKPRTLQTFLMAECANITDFVKQRKSVDLEKLFFGQDGYLDDDDDNEDDEQEEVEPKDVKADGVEKSPTTEKPKVFAGRKALRQALVSGGFCGYMVALFVAL